MSVTLKPGSELMEIQIRDSKTGLMRTFYINRDAEKDTLARLARRDIEEKVNKEIGYAGREPWTIDKIDSGAATFYETLFAIDSQIKLMRTHEKRIPYIKHLFCAFYAWIIVREELEIDMEKEKERNFQKGEEKNAINIHMARWGEYNHKIPHLDLCNTVKRVWEVFNFWDVVK